MRQLWSTLSQEKPISCRYTEPFITFVYMNSLEHFFPVSIRSLLFSCFFHSNSLLVTLFPCKMVFLNQNKLVINKLPKCTAQSKYTTKQLLNGWAQTQGTNGQIYLNDLRRVPNFYEINPQQVNKKFQIFCINLNIIFWLKNLITFVKLSITLYLDGSLAKVVSLS